MKRFIVGVLVSQTFGICANANTQLFKTGADRYTVILSGGDQTARLASTVGTNEITNDGDFTNIRCLSASYCEFSFKVNTIADYNKMSSPFT